MRRAKFRYKTLTLGRSHSEVGAARCTEEQPIDCPDCHDMMNIVYDWDKIRYLCENCDLMLAKTSPKKEEQ